jgi:hypothetical protein
MINESVSQIFSIPTINQEKKVTIASLSPFNVVLETTFMATRLQLTFFVINWCYKKDLRHAKKI